MPVIDHMNTVFLEAPDKEKNTSWFQGMRLAVLELRKVLQLRGLEPISVEGKFDPNIHQPVGTAPGPEGVILKVVEMGYNLNGKILKFAKVIVGKEAN